MNNNKSLWVVWMHQILCYGLYKRKGPWLQFWRRSPVPPACPRRCAGPCGAACRQLAGSQTVMKSLGWGRFAHLEIAALFTIARTWKQPKCPSTDEWIKEMWHRYTMEYYSAIKRNEIELFVVRWVDLESVIQGEVSQRKTNTVC